MAPASARRAAALAGSDERARQAAPTIGALTLTVAEMHPAKPALAASDNAPSALGNTARLRCAEARAMEYLRSPELSFNPRTTSPCRSTRRATVSGSNGTPEFCG